MAPTHAPTSVGFPLWTHSIISQVKSAHDAEISELTAA
jgi:hypothetical protein